ncbi:MAG: transpeptidase-transglycosylase [Elusimicrobia bacterium]|nr:MAG: transpeptidase-transglycosylase [Elusimicrobiota bacterium]
MARRKPRRSKSSPRRSIKKRPAPRWLWAFASGLGFFAAGALSLAIYAEKRIAPLLDGASRPHYTTRVLSSPVRLRPGTPISAKELKHRLKRLNYKRVEAPPNEGEYRRTSDAFIVNLRDFDHPFVRSTPNAAAIEIHHGRVQSLRLADENIPLIEAVLEPELLYELSGSNRVRRTPLAAGDIPATMTQALIAIEDRRFFSHSGIDPRGIARAAWRNLRSHRITEGGSTLTQQLAKNLFLTPERSFSRKIKEAFIAVYLEARYSKSEILRLYLDSVYFGQKGPVSIVGLHEAARHFFALTPHELSVPQCALLAGLLRSPSGYNPFRHPKRAHKRRSEVITAMHREGFLSPTQTRLAREAPLGVTRSAHITPRDADHFLAYIQRALASRYSDEAWMTRGMTVHTTLDPWLQEQASKAVAGAKHEAALIALDPRTGAIRALVGGRKFAESAFDRATQARRQPGSAFKPFVYGAALRSGPNRAAMTPATLLSDTTRAYRIAGGTWVPRNYSRSYQGPVPLREALARSLNAATVNLAAEIGPKAIIEYARELGIRSPLRPTLGLALGASEVSLLEITGAYAPFANGGYRVEPFGVEAALDTRGSVLEFHHRQPRVVLNPAEVYLMTDLLREVVRTGTARSLARWGLAQNAAGKTGTSNDGKDAWFIGYTPRIVAGVWSGSDIPTALGITGASAALPIWAKFVKTTGGPASQGDVWPKPESVRTATIDPNSGGIASAGCRERRTEIFAAGTEPTTPCPLHSRGPWGWLKRMFSSEKPAPKNSYR